MLKRLIGWWRTGNGESHEGIRSESHEGIRSESHEGIRSESHEGIRSESIDRSKPLPCPFCGKNPTVRHYSHGQTAIDCTTDGCSRGICATKEIAIRAWNTRGGTEL